MSKKKRRRRKNGDKEEGGWRERKGEGRGKGTRLQNNQRQNKKSSVFHEKGKDEIKTKKADLVGMSVSQLLWRLRLKMQV